MSPRMLRALPCYNILHSTSFLNRPSPLLLFSSFTIVLVYNTLHSRIPSPHLPLSSVNPLSLFTTHFTLLFRSPPFIPSLFKPIASVYNTLHCFIPFIPTSILYGIHPLSKNLTHVRLSVHPSNRADLSFKQSSFKKGLIHMRRVSSAAAAYLAACWTQRYWSPDGYRRSRRPPRCS